MMDLGRNERVPKQTQADKAQRDGKTANNPGAVNSVRKARAHLRADQYSEAEHDCPADTASESTREEVHGSPSEGHRRQNKMRSRCRDVNGEVKKMNQSRDMYEPAPNAEKAG